MSAESLQIIQGQGWQRGLGNLFKYEMFVWLKTRKWWIQSLLWLAIIDGIMALTLIDEVPSIKETTMLY